MENKQRLAPPKGWLNVLARFTGRLLADCILTWTKQVVRLMCFVFLVRLYLTSVKYK